jgi:hypothetical protein
MSEREDFLARWSRRKRQKVEKVGGDQAEDAASPAAASAPEDTADADTPEKGARPAEPPGPLFDPKTLPSIEAITAQTDIRAFLAPGVPAELTRAALRRAWAADPKIRDFVGLADYAWDFNAPGAMAGFGPLEMTDELRREIVGMLTGGRSAEAPATNSAAAPQEKAEQPGLGSEQVAQPLEYESRQDAVEEDQDRTLDHDDLTLCSEENIALQNQPAKQPASQSIVQRSHGRALPKS